MNLFDEFMVHEVQVFPQILSDDDPAGSPELIDGPPVTVPCMILPLGSKESTLRGLSIDSTYRLTTASEWPGGPVSRIIWDGRPYGQAGAAQRVSTGSELDHTTVILTEDAPAVH